MKFNHDDQELIDQMINLGFHISNKGFIYIIDAVKIIDGNDGYIAKIRMLYKHIANLHNATSTGVERCIRTEIERFYNEVYEVPIRLMPDANTGKLNNKEFLHRLTYLLYIES